MENWSNGELLGQVDAFRSLGDEACEQLGQHFVERTVEQGEVLFREGDQIKQLFIVVSGMVDIVLPARSEALVRVSSLAIATLGPGECVGEYSLIDMRPASASAVARERSRLLWIGTADLQSVLNGHCEIAREFYYNLALMLVDRLRQHNEELDLITLG